jgi:uncharacterized membrane protein HdeD (DUF308 family)
MNLETPMRDGERALAHIWKVTALRGAVAIAFAVMIVVWPNIGLASLVALFGALALVSGAGTIYGAVRVPMERGQRAWLVVEGMVGVAVGVAVFVWPDLSALGLLYAIATWAIATGIIEIGLAFRLPLTRKGALLLGLGGLLSIGFGVIMIAEPGAGALALLALIAALALVSGIMQVAFAIELRRFLGELRPGPRPRATAKPVPHT